MGYAQQPGFRARPVVPPPREAEVLKVDAVRVPEPPAPVEPEREVAPVETVPPPTEETKAELLPDREGKVSIQVKPFKRDDPPALPDRTTRVLVSPIAPLSSPATPMEKPAPSPGKIASSPVTDYASTPTREEPGKTETPAKKPNYISLPARPRASSSTVPPTPGVRTPAAPTALRQTTFPRPPAAAAAWGWKEYPPPREVTFRERPTGQDVVLELKAMGVVLPDEGYRGLAERDMTRVAGDWERQVRLLLFLVCDLSNIFLLIARENAIRTRPPHTLIPDHRFEPASQKVRARECVGRGLGCREEDRGGRDDDGERGVLPKEGVGVTRILWTDAVCMAQNG